MQKKSTKKIFIISAPSGTGKTTIATILRRKIPDLEHVISCTTRKPRPAEKDGINYHFITHERFRGMAKKKEFAEWAEVYGNLYGTPKKEILARLKKGNRILLTLDTQGGISIRRVFPSVVLIGILPPSNKEQERRIRNRSGLSEKELGERMASAREERRILMDKYDFRLVNINLDSTVRKIRNIIERGSKC